MARSSGGQTHPWRTKNGVFAGNVVGVAAGLSSRIGVPVVGRCVARADAAKARHGRYDRERHNNTSHLSPPLR